MMNRNIGIEYLRVYASVAVVIIHVSALAIRQTVGYSYELAMVLDAFSRFAVPIFFMISGYLMIQPQKNLTFAMSWKKTWQRVISPLIFWVGAYIVFSIGFYVWRYGITTPTAIVERIGSGETLYHFWFLPVLALYYLATPLFSRFVSKQSVKGVWVAIILSFTLGFIMQVIGANSTNGLFILLKIVGFSGYYLFGYLIREQKWQLRLRVGLSGYIGCSFLTLISLYTTYQLLPPTQTINLITDNFFPPIIIASLLVFSMMVHRQFPLNRRTTAMLWLSPYTFGIYLVHVAVLSLLSSFPEIQIFPMFLNTSYLIFSVLGISLLLVYILRKIPYLRRFT